MPHSQLRKSRARSLRLMCVGVRSRVRVGPSTAPSLQYSVCNGRWALRMFGVHVVCWPSDSMARLTEALRGGSVSTGGQQHTTGSGEDSWPTSNDRDKASVRGRMLSSDRKEKERERSPHNPSYMHTSSAPRDLSQGFTP